MKKKRRNRGSEPKGRLRDEPQVLEVPPPLEDPPETPASVTGALKVIAQIPLSQKSRLAWLLIMQHTCEGEAFLRRTADVTHLTPIADLESFMRRNWESPQSPNLKGRPGLQHWHPEAALELLRTEGFWPGGRKWYEKWCHRFGLKPKLPYKVKPPEKKA